MSTRRGANLRDRPQKYKNRTAFKNDLHDKTPQIKFLNTLQISEVCEHCKSVIEWKIKYKKYKPLSQPKTCSKCGQRNVRKAYHVNCTECALKNRCCAKCNKSADQVHILPPAPTPQEQIKLDSEMQMLIKKLPERKRRTFLRYMKKGKKKEREEGDASDDEDSAADNVKGDATVEEGVEQETAPVEETIPYTKEELLAKLERMKLALDDDDEEFDDEFFDEFDDDEDDDEDEGADFDDEDVEEEEESSNEHKDQEKPKKVVFAEGVKK